VIILIESFWRLTGKKIIKGRENGILIQPITMVKVNSEYIYSLKETI